METVISGVAQTGSVRVNNLAMLEALLNIYVNGIEILLIAFGALLFMTALYRRRRAVRTHEVPVGTSLICLTRTFTGSIGWQAFLSIALLTLGVNIPVAINRVWEGLRYANLFQ